MCHSAASVLDIISFETWLFNSCLGELISVTLLSRYDGKPEDVLNPKKKQLEKITPVCIPMRLDSVYLFFKNSDKLLFHVFYCLEPILILYVYNYVYANGMFTCNSKHRGCVRVLEVTIVYDLKINCWPYFLQLSKTSHDYDLKRWRLCYSLF